MEPRPDPDQPGPGGLHPSTHTGDEMADPETITNADDGRPRPPADPLNPSTPPASPRASAPLLPPSIGGESVLPGSGLTGGVENNLEDARHDHDPATRPEDEIEFGVGPVIGSVQPAEIDVLPDAAPGSRDGSLTGGASGGKMRIGDRIFSGLAMGAGGVIVLLVALIALFLLLQAVPAIKNDKANFLLSRNWNVSPGDLDFGVLQLLWTTVVVSMIAMLLAVPVAIGIALFITHYAPRAIARPVAYIVDLLAAIPSIVYGIWGIGVLAPHLKPVQQALYHLGIGIFSDKHVLTGSIFDGSIVLAVMILPIVTAISRDVFERTPRYNIEAALALGATKWEMIRMAVLPFGRPGVISASMLGLGRALGETIAIALILSAPGNGAPFSWSIFAGGETFASKIANNAAEFDDPKSTGAYIAAGLVLFVLTFIVNAIARAIVNRRKEFA
jgi:phosphate transport system permease protein